MVLNSTLEYGLKSLFYIARLPSGEVVEAKEIAENEGISAYYLSKILKKLSKAGILISIRGKGFFLSKPLFWKEPPKKQHTILKTVCKVLN